MPGIEGSEEAIKEDLQNGLAKSHVIFYIKNNPYPPQKGDDGVKGTLEKIKEHLWSECEVYLLINERVNNPKGLKNLHYEEDKLKALSELEAEMKRSVGEVYKGYRVFCALSAFLALATHLLSSEVLEEYKIDCSLNIHQREKFLKDYKQEELLEHTGFKAFVDLLESFLKNSKNIIYKSHLKKAQSIVYKFKECIGEILEKFYKPLLEEQNREYKHTQGKLKRTLKAYKNHLRLQMESKVREKIKDIREKAYSYIYTDDRSNKDLEYKLEGLLKDLEKHLGRELEKIALEQQEKCKKKIEEIVRDYEARMQRCVAYFKEEMATMVGRVETESGIDWLGLTTSVGGSAVGIAGAIFLILEKSTIIGFISLGISIVVGIIGVAKSVWGWFDKEYKRRQQKQKVEEALGRVREEIEKNLEENCHLAEKQVGKVIKGILHELKEASYGLKENIETLEKIESELGELEGKLPTLLLAYKKENKEGK